MSSPLVLPQHVAIIMDGNGRWAKKRLFPRTKGHRAAVKSIREVIEFSVEKNISILTLFAFGRDNWQRPKDEIDRLMKLFSEVLISETKMMCDNNVRLFVVGDRSRLSIDVVHNIYKAEQATSSNKGLTLNIAIDYSGQWEIVQAAKKLALTCENGELNSNDITEEKMTSALMDSIQQPVDLLIRTSGELRVSNFMIWQLSYAELYFTDKFWPDFSKQDFQLALDNFTQRKRRFGKIDEQI